MTFPVYLNLFGHRVHPHLVMELIAYTGGFQIYRMTRSRWPRANMSFEQTLWVFVGAVFGALIGSKLLAWIESLPDYWPHRFDPETWLAGKTIVGGLLGGWAGVEIAKKLLHVTHSTGDAFVFPLIFGMAVGRIGCFLTGLDDHTHGIATTLPWGIDFGDGIHRHPTQLYDILFLSLLAIALGARRHRQRNGDLFLIFLTSYCAWRFFAEFLKPTWKPYLALSPIQFACAIAIIACFVKGRTASREPNGAAYDTAPAHS
jgi:prolipoprotein diacylglyceryltransferase